MMIIHASMGVDKYPQLLFVKMYPQLFFVKKYPQLLFGKVRAAVIGGVGIPWNNKKPALIVASAVRFLIIALLPFLLPLLHRLYR